MVWIAVVLALGIVLVFFWRLQSRPMIAQESGIRGHRSRLRDRVSAAELCNARRRLSDALDRILAADEETFSWVGENAGYLEQTLFTLQEEFRPAAAALPCFGGRLRADALCCRWVREKKGAPVLREITEELRSLQEGEAMEMAELEAIPLYLRKQLGLFLEGILSECARRQEQAFRALRDAASAQLVPERLLDTAYAAAFAQALENGENNRLLARSFCELLARRGLTPEGVCARDHRRQTELTAQALQTLSALREWETVTRNGFLARVSLTEETLRKDAVYAAMDEESRGAYRAALGVWARSFRLSELYLAQITLDCIREHPQDPVLGHVGYYLLRRGIVILAQRVGCSMKYPSDDRTWLLFQGLWWLFSAAIVLSAFALGGVHWLIALWLPARQGSWEALRHIPGSTYRHWVPRLEVGDALPEGRRMLLTLPTLVTDAADVEKHFTHLEACYLANRVEGLHAVLLADLPECRTQPEEPLALYEAGAACAQRLCARYGADSFVFLLRRRVYVKTQRAYLGRERKRGALDALNRLVHEGDLGDFVGITVCPDGIFRADWVCCIDQDTQILPGTVKLFAGALAHPLNRPVVSHGRVVQGYGLVTPRLETAFESGQSAFSRVMEGPGGMDSYQMAAGEFHQDHLGQAIFMGKGAYWVETALQTASRWIAPERVLSHDLLEGCFLRAGRIGDAVMLDGSPRSFSSWLKRNHRWVRGDWQLIPYLFPRIRDAKGEWHSNPLTFLHRSWILQNLMRSLTPAALTLLPLWGVYTDRPWWGLALTAMYFVLPVVVRMIRGSLTHFREAYEPTGDLAMLARAGFDFVTLPLSAWTNLHAALTASWALLSGRGLLSWTTAAQTEARGQTGFGKWAFYLPQGLFALGLCVLGFLRSWPEGVTAALFWLFGIALCIRLDRPNPSSSQALSEEQREILQRYARATFGYFEEMCTAQDHFLPPDNIQLHPVQRVAHRTSPTNIGMALAVQAASVLVGYQSREDACIRLHHMLDSVERLERWHGHLFNWYDTQTLSALEPRYVSTVDSGNFVACLYLVYAFVQDWEQELALRVLQLAQEADFSALYRRDRDLFSIGANPDTGEVSGTYDLLASEARLTSFLAVATGQVPVKHWFRLGRPVHKSGRDRMLLSWGGTLFEYLMPTLFVREEEGTLLGEAARLALSAQENYVQRLSLPLGVTESGYAAFDRDMNYQYRSFGVPACAMRRTGDLPRVISPYASFMALHLDRSAMLSNLVRLEEMGALESWGFCEAVDADPSRLRQGESYRIVRSAMAHHQGMIFLALIRELTEDALREHFMALPFVRGAVMLLSEKPSLSAGIRHLPQRTQPERSSLPQGSPVLQVENREDPMKAAVLLGGRDFCAVAESRGIVSLRRGDCCLTRLRRTQAEEPQGLLVFTQVRGQGCSRLGQDTLAVLEGHRASYRSRIGAVEEEVSFWADPQCSALRGQVSLRNDSDRELTVDLTACLEPSLTEYEADLNHRSYQGLFMECAVMEKGILCLRRPHKEGQAPLSLALVFPEGENMEWTFSRVAALGRRRSWREPELLDLTPLGRMDGSTTDPVLCLRQSLTLSAGESLQFPLFVAVGSDASSLRQHCRNLCRGDNSLDLAWHSHQALIYSLKITPSQELLCSRLLPALVWEEPLQCSRAKALVSARTRPEDFFVWGLSDRLPIVTFVVERREDAEKFRHLCICQRYLSELGYPFTLCALYRDEGDYPRNLAAHLETQLPLPGMGNIHLLRRDPRSEAEIQALLASSRLILHGRESLTSQLVYEESSRMQPCGEASLVPRAEDHLLQFNGWGGFDPNGRYYRICPMMGRTPRPWTQVLSNGMCGAVVTSDMGGFLFQGNSQKEPLTEFAGDAVRDPAFCEILCEDASERAFCLSAPGGAYIYPGGIRWQYRQETLQATMDLFAPGKGEMLVFLLRLKSRDGGDYRLTLAPRIRLTRAVEANQATLWYPLDQGFLACNAPTDCGTLFFALSGCGTQVEEPRSDHPVITLHTRLEAGQTTLFAFGIGRRNTMQEALDAVSQLSDAPTLARLSERTQSEWEARLSALCVRSAHGDIDRMVNTFLPYQAWACRLLARSGYDQTGGAFGFRDQLQDAVALLWHDPAIARRQILACAAHQFPEGDVQHWWHEPAQGVRTRMSDDRLFLPWAVTEYCRFTGDRTILSQKIPYLSGSPLQEGEEDRYESAQPGDHSEPLWMHCVRAVEAGFASGPHGLPLMGTGDWNDAMNRVGHKGRGESLFVAFLGIVCIREFLPILEAFGEETRVRAWREKMGQWIDAVEKHGWDGAWYRRAFADDGSILGSAAASACKIDALTQAWAVFALGATDRTRQALQSALTRLWDREHHLFRLLDPPFTAMGEAGYISGYQAGVRENGGQYTHAAAWTVLALCRVGEVETAYTLYSDLLPCSLTDDAQKVMQYQGEPYVCAADVYTAPGMVGQAGWTWYTGSAGWLLRAAVEGLIGAVKTADAVEFRHAPPEALGNVTLIHRGKSYTSS